MENALKSLVNSLRPIMQRDGGDVTLKGYDEHTHTVFLHFKRANYHCSGANGAMQMLYERKICAVFPDVEHVSVSEE